MHRLQGEIKWLRTKDFNEVEPDLLKAMDVATAQESPTFWLRAATSLLRLSRGRKDLTAAEKERRIAKYKDLLASVYRSFDGQPDSLICERLAPCWQRVPLQSAP